MNKIPITSYVIHFIFVQSCLLRTALAAQRQPQTSFSPHSTPDHDYSYFYSSDNHDNFYDCSYSSDYDYFHDINRDFCDTMCKHTGVTNNGAKVTSTLDESVSLINLHQGPTTWLLIATVLSVLFYCIWRRCKPRTSRYTETSSPPPPPPAASPPWSLPIQHIQNPMMPPIQFLPINHPTCLHQIPTPAPPPLHLTLHQGSETEDSTKSPDHQITKSPNHQIINRPFSGKVIPQEI